MSYTRKQIRFMAVMDMAGMTAGEVDVWMELNFNGRTIESLTGTEAVLAADMIRLDIRMARIKPKTEEEMESEWESEYADIIEESKRGMETAPQ